jgi:predicted GIY-YIG superfamily endonuclease
MAFYAYMLECSDRSIYTGQRDNLEARLAAHQDGRFRGYTFKRRPVRLIFHESFSTREEALSAEREIKGWSREKKWALVRHDWEVLKDLSMRRTPRRWLTERGATAHPSSKPQDEREATSSKS